jgi:hypothetical protein
MARMLLFALQRACSFLDGFKYGTRAGDYSPALSLVWEVVSWLL